MSVFVGIYRCEQFIFMFVRTSNNLSWRVIFLSTSKDVGDVANTDDYRQGSGMLRYVARHTGPISKGRAMAVAYYYRVLRSSPGVLASPTVLHTVVGFSSDITQRSMALLWALHLPRGLLRLLN